MTARTAQEYFVLHFTEDGEVHFDEMPAEQLTERLSDEYWGNCPIITKLDKRGADYTVGIMIIKGKIVSPQPIDVVKSWSVE